MHNAVTGSHNSMAVTIYAIPLKRHLITFALQTTVAQGRGVGAWSSPQMQKCSGNGSKASSALLARSAFIFCSNISPLSMRLNLSGFPRLFFIVFSTTFCQLWLRSLLTESWSQGLKLMSHRLNWHACSEGLCIYSMQAFGVLCDETLSAVLNHKSVANDTAN